MELLAATPMLSVRRNRALSRLAAKLVEDSELRERLVAGEPGVAELTLEPLEFEFELGATRLTGNEAFAKL